MNTGELIRRTRKLKNLTQKQLGDLCGMADSAIRRYESGRGNPTLGTLQRIADALQVPVNSLLNRTAQDAYDKGFDTATELHDYYETLTNELMKEMYGYTGSEAEATLIKAFSALNEEGQKKAIERVEELLEISKYQAPAAPKEEPSSISDLLSGEEVPF